MRHRDIDDEKNNDCKKVIKDFCSSHNKKLDISSYSSPFSKAFTRRKRSLIEINRLDFVPIRLICNEHSATSDYLVARSLNTKNTSLCLISEIHKIGWHSTLAIRNQLWSQQFHYAYYRSYHYVCTKRSWMRLHT